jgi:hypothetical protein
MLSVPEMLQYEIDRLKTERCYLLAQRAGLTAPLDLQISDVEKRLTAAERMLKTYRTARKDRSPADGEALLVDLESARASIDAVAIPEVLKGHRVRQSSKRTAIIRATKVFLQASGRSPTSKILDFLTRLGIMANEKNPKAYLSVVLSQTSEIFSSNRAGWDLRENADRENLDHVIKG